MCTFCMITLTEHQSTATVEKGGMRNTSRLIQPGIRSRQVSPIINKWLTFSVCVVTSPRAPVRTQQSLDPIPAVYQCNRRGHLRNLHDKHLGDEPRMANSGPAKWLLPVWFTAQTSTTIVWYSDWNGHVVTTPSLILTQQFLWGEDVISYFNIFNSFYIITMGELARTL